MDAAPEPPDRGAAIAVAPTRISARSSRIVRWCVSSAVAVSLALPAVLLTVSALSGDEPAAALIVALLLWDVAMAAVLGWLVVVLPQHWTAQGVDVDSLGVAFTARPLWWFRGRHTAVPWGDVLAVSRGTRIAGRGFGGPSPAALLDRLTSLGHERTLQFHVHDLPERSRLPAWATPVPAPGQGAATIVVTLADQPRSRLDHLVRNLVADAAPQARRDGSAWVSLRGVGIVSHRFSMTGLTLLGAGVVATVALVYGVIDGLARGFGPDHQALVILVPAGLPVPAWLGYRLPRILTRQGVAVDHEGVTLVQEPKWWWPGATVRLPWGDIRSVDDDLVVKGDAKNRRSQLVVTLGLTRPAPHPLPSWVETKSRRDERTALVLFPGRRHGRLLAALRAARPR